MLLFPRFFYDDSAADNQGGGTNDAPIIDAPAVLPEDIQKELAELRAFRETHKPLDVKTSEEIAKAEQTRKADFIKYSVEEDLLKVEDFTKYESLNAKADRDLVYESWYENWKSENTEVDPADAAEQAKRDFEAEYKLDATNEKTKARGEARLKKEAEEMRSPVVNSYKKAEHQFSNYITAKESLPNFHKAVDDIIKEAVPDDLTYKTKEGEEDVVIDGVKLTPADKAEIAKVFKSNKNFISFLQNKGDTAALKELISNKVQGYLTVKYAKQIQDKIYETAHGIGMKKGSTVGAKNPFGLTGANGGQQGAQVIEMDATKANQAANKYRKSR